MIHWKPRKRHDETSTSKRTLHESAEGYVMIESRPKLAALHRSYWAMRDMSTPISEHRTAEAAYAACERDARNRFSSSPTQTSAVRGAARRTRRVQAETLFTPGEKSARHEQLVSGS